MVDGYFKTMDAYTPTFTNYNGGIYEMELTRSAIHSTATAVSKLKPEFQGNAYKSLGKRMQYKPNPFMDTTKFLYRIATTVEADTTAFIVPLYAEDYETIVGYYPLLPNSTEIVEVAGEMYLRYTFANGQRAAIEFDRVGIITKFQYESDFFGSGNKALMPTLNLMDVQKQGMEEAIRQSAVIRFMAKIGNTLRPEDISKERERFSKENLSADNQSGVMMFDAKYSDVQQIDSKPFVVDDKQMAQINQNVFNYFGVNEDILQNKFNEDTWNAFYEGKIEPLALQIGLVLTNMTFTDKEIAHGNNVILTSNRMQYASNKTKLEVSTQMFDRGLFTMNQVMDVWNMAHVEDGDKRYIRREYVDVDNLDKELEGDDIVADSEDERVSESDVTGTDNGTESET